MNHPYIQFLHLEKFKDESSKRLAILLSVGFALILSTATSLSWNQRRNMPIDEQELAILREKYAQTLEDSHFDNNRGKLIAFHQGAHDKKTKNKALLQFEKCNHKTYGEAVLCIKVSLHTYMPIYLIMYFERFFVSSDLLDL